MAGLNARAGRTLGPCVIASMRAGGMKSLFARVNAPPAVGTLLREFTFGHAWQLDCVLTAVSGRPVPAGGSAARDTPRSPVNESCAKDSHR